MMQSIHKRTPGWKAGCSKSISLKPRKLLMCSTNVAWVVDKIKEPSPEQTLDTKLVWDRSMYL